jgi:twitching motility protein PilT
MQTNRKAGMVTLNDALMELVDQGLVEAKEAYMKAVEKAGFAQALKAKRHDVAFLSEA